jgi:Flp pilus assembly protein TadD
LLEQARDLASRGKLEKALKRLDWIADVDERFPGLWELAATVYDQLGETEVADECRRRAAEGSRTKGLR